VPGIGKRTAERIIVELREKVAGNLEEAIATGTEQGGDPRALARDGLVNLGYTPAEAEGLLGDAESDQPEELIAAALRRAGEAQAA
jgi:Holliday junction DNA helicase RuvA